MDALGTVKKPRVIRALAHRDLIGRGELRLAYKVHGLGIFICELRDFSSKTAMDAKDLER